jgi:hypothetical protein
MHYLALDAFVSFYVCGLEDQQQVQVNICLRLALHLAFYYARVLL